MIEYLAYWHKSKVKIYIHLLSKISGLNENIIYLCQKLKHFNMDFINIIKQHQERLNITNREMSIAADITPQYYKLLLDGKSSANIIIIDLLARKVGLKLTLISEESLKMLNS